jgi:hypothetical protein
LLALKALAAKGEPVPPEVQQMIESDPELKKAIEDAMTKGGDVLEGTYVYSSQFVDATANIIAPGGALSNNRSHFNITGGTGPAKGGG